MYFGHPEKRCLGGKFLPQKRKIFPIKNFMKHIKKFKTFKKFVHHPSEEGGVRLKMANVILFLTLPELNPYIMKFTFLQMLDLL